MKCIAVMAAAIAFACACSDLTGPSTEAMLGCHTLATSATSNGTPARTALVRLRSNSVDLMATYGNFHGTWQLQDGTLMMWFGIGFAGVTYEFTSYVAMRWIGAARFWTDDTAGDATARVQLIRTRCP